MKDTSKKHGKCAYGVYSQSFLYDKHKQTLNEMVKEEKINSVI